MAFPGTPSTTGAATLGNTVPSWYNRVMLDWLIPELRFYQYADKKPIPQGEGTSVVWNRKVTIHEGYKASEGYPISAVKTLSTNKVSALLETLADGVVVSEMAYLASVIDTDVYAMEVLAQAAAKTVEKFIIHALVADSVVKHYVKKAGSVISSNSAAVSATASGPRLALSDIRVASTYLQSFNVPTWDGMNYVGIIHPKQMADLYSDSGFTNWVARKSPRPISQRCDMIKLSKIRETPTRDNPELTQNGKSNDYELTTKILSYRNVIGRCFYRTNISEICSILYNPRQEAGRLLALEGWGA